VRELKKYQNPIHEGQESSEYRGSIDKKIRDEVKRSGEVQAKSYL